MRPWHCQFVRTGAKWIFELLHFAFLPVLGRICHGFSRILAAAHFLPLRTGWWEFLHARHWGDMKAGGLTCWALRTATRNLFARSRNSFAKKFNFHLAVHKQSENQAHTPTTYLPTYPLTSSSSKSVSQKLVFTSGNMFERLLMAPQSRRWITVLEIPSHLPNHPEGAVGKAVDKLTWKRV